MYDTVNQGYNPGRGGMVCPVRVECQKLKEKLRDFARIKQIPV